MIAKLATVAVLVTIVAASQAAAAVAAAGPMLVDGSSAGAPSDPVDPVAGTGQTATTTWTDTAGRVHSISTERKGGESQPHWAGRHAEAVSAFTAVFPPA